MGHHRWIKGLMRFYNRHIDWHMKIPAAPLKPPTCIRLKKDKGKTQRGFRFRPIQSQSVKTILKAKWSSSRSVFINCSTNRTQRFRRQWPIALAFNPNAPMECKITRDIGNQQYPVMLIALDYSRRNLPLLACIIHWLINNLSIPFNLLKLFKGRRPGRLRRFSSLNRFRCNCINRLNMNRGRYGLWKSDLIISALIIVPSVFVRKI